MRIGGLQEFSLIDYPGKMAAVVFTQGCNLRCPYCHNSELALPELYGPLIPEEEVLQFLGRRVGKLEGVVVTGGEPTLQKDLTAFLQRVKSLGFLVKLDTNGSQPGIVKRILESKLVDYVAMDVKASLDNYARLAGRPISLEDIRLSIELLRNSGVACEFRTTLVKPLHGRPDKEISRIREFIGEVSCYRLQRFVPSAKVMDKSLLKAVHFTEEELDRLRERWEVAQQLQKV